MAPHRTRSAAPFPECLGANGLVQRTVRSTYLWPNMKNVYRTLAIVAVVLTAVVGYNLYEPPPAKCALCFDSDCYSSNECGGDGCVCLRKPMEMTGRCFSLD